MSREIRISRMIFEINNLIHQVCVRFRRGGIDKMEDGELKLIYTNKDRSKNFTMEFEIINGRTQPITDLPKDLRHLAPTPDYNQLAKVDIKPSEMFDDLRKQWDMDKNNLLKLECDLLKSFIVELEEAGKKG